MSRGVFVDRRVPPTRLPLFAVLFWGAACSSEPFSGRDCRTNQDCGALEVCVGGVCSAEGRCQSDAQCDVGEACDPGAGACVRVVPVVCERDADCPVGERCAQPAGVCLAEGAPCTEQVCSAAGQVCDSATGACVDCLGDADCASAEMCVDRRCVERPDPACQSDADCGAPVEICEATTGACIPGCGTSSCPPGLGCRASTGRCEPASVAPVGAGEPCARNLDCAEGVCFDFGSPLGRICATSCASSADCPSGFACGGHLGAKTCIAARYFEDATFVGPTGSACTRGVDCRSGFCREGRICADTCNGDADCAENACVWEEILPDAFLASCTTPTGSGENGSPCAQGTDCASGVCYAPGICGHLCGSTRDCGSGTVCVPVDHSVCLRGGAPCLEWQVNLVRACVRAEPGTIGGEPVGSPCRLGSECRDGFCDTVGGVCSGSCSRDADCPSPMRCGIEPYARLGDLTVYFNACIVP